MIQSLEFTDCYLDSNDNIWFCSVDFNGFFRYGLSDEKSVWEGSIPNESAWQTMLYRTCVEHNNKLYLVPYNAEEIAVYDLENIRFEKISFDDHGQKKTKFTIAAAYDNRIFMFGDRAPFVLILDTDTNEISYYQDLHQKLEADQKTDEDFYLSKSMVVDGKYCYFLAAKLNSLIVFDMENVGFELFSLGDSRGIYNNLIKIGDTLFLIPGRFRKFATFDLDKKVITEYGEEIQNKAQFFGTYYYDGTIYALPDTSDKVMKVTIGEANTVEQSFPDLRIFLAKKIKDEKIENHKGPKFLAVLDRGKYIFAFSRIDKTLFILDKKTGLMMNKTLNMDAEMRVLISNDHGGMITSGHDKLGLSRHEDSVFGLNSFIEYIAQ